MLGTLLSELYPYQIFRSVLFRGGMGYITAYFLVVVVMPRVIAYFRQKGIASDFKKNDILADYSGATPIMGGVVLVPAVLISSLLWLWLNPYTVSMLLLLLGYAAIGLADDICKVRQKLRIDQNLEEKKSYADKSEGLSESLRLGLEGALVLVVFGLLVFVYDVPKPVLQIPFVPIKNFQLELNTFVYLLMIFFIVVGGSNAVNMTDGLDSLVTIPLLTCLLFAGAVAYIAGDVDWSTRLKITFLSNDIKEVAILCAIAVGTLMAFLKFNCPPAAIYMGDVGSLGYGALVCSILVVVKVELYIPIVGGIFFVAGLSSFVQRLFFLCMLKMKGRQYAEANRFFYKAPYHHHQQAVMSAKDASTRSFYHQTLVRLKLKRKPDRYKDPVSVNSKVIWNTHIRAIWLLIITIIIYFKVR